jgi:hypothetical protein
MKTPYFLILFTLMFVVMLSSCKKDDDDNPKPSDPTGEVVPPDNDPVVGTVTGEISEIVFTESLSTSTITFSRLPHSLGKFLELRNQVAHTPQGAAAMMVVAMHIYKQFPVEGMKCLTANCTSPLVVPATNNAGAYEGYVMGNTSELQRKLKDYPHLPNVYFSGASPANQYTPDGPPYTMELATNLYSYQSSTDGSTRIKLFVSTLGADSPRPVVVRKIGDLYMVTEYSSLYLAPKPIMP